MVNALTFTTVDRSSLPTFPEVIGDWVRKYPDRRALLFLKDGEEAEASLSYGQLWDSALCVAEQVLCVAKPGDRAILFYPAGLDFLVVFLGCLCAGVVAVPVSLPNRKRGMEIIQGITSDSGAVCILSTGEFLRRHEEDFASEPNLASVPRFDTVPWRTSGRSQTQLVLPPREAPALLQYTSGSTGKPRGVAVTQANLVANHREMQTCFGHDEHTVVVSWLPMFHDMGLGTALQSLLVGGECVLMSPGAFLQKPARWLRAISNYRATFSGAPDFAFDLCARRVSPEEREGLDLSAWRGAYNGSEPVRATSLVRFHQVFQTNGFRWEHFKAVYGLAEATLFVTGEDVQRGPQVKRFSRIGLADGEARVDETEGSHALVSCGHPWLNAQVLIVDPETGVECPPERIGEIWLGGPSIAAGYWGREEETLRTFQARTSDGRGPFLRTGDLGFLHGGSLFITGRSKDLIIVRGRNHYPQDIEDTVSDCHPALEPQRCAAFSVETNEGESLVVAQEVKRTALRGLDTEEVLREIRRSVADQHGLYAAAIVLLRPLALPRTTSGKVRRKACREGFLNQSLATVAVSGLVGAKLDPPPRSTLTPPDAASLSAARLMQWLRQHARAASSGEMARPRLAPDSLSEFARQGFFGLQIATQHGGLGLRHAETLRVLEQLGGSDLGAALFIGLNNYLGVWPILRYAQASFQQELLPQLAAGQQTVGFALVEPGTDSQQQGWRSHAERVNGSGWRLFGTKLVNGGMAGSGVLNVFVRHDDPPGVSGFVVAQNARGMARSTSVLDESMARETLRLDGVFVEPRQLLGTLGKGEDVAFDAIRHSHLAIGAACLGGMKRCSQLIFQHATQRQLGDSGLVAHPVTLTRLGRITAEITALESLVRLLAEMVDENRSVAPEAFTVCRLIGAEMLWQAVDDLVQLLGRRGLVETLQIRQLVDDARALRGLEGPLEAGLALLGAGLLHEDTAVSGGFAGDGLGDLSLEPFREKAALALHEVGLSSRDHSEGAKHWVSARAGELTSSMILLASVERRRRGSSSADLERTAAWIRSNFENTLTLLRSGPPPQANLAAVAVGEAIASYDRSMGSVGEGTSIIASTGADSPRRRELRTWAIGWLAARLQVEESRIDARRSFADHGVDSLAAVEFAKALADRVGMALDETLLWNFPTIEALLSYLESPTVPPKAPKVEPLDTITDVVRSSSSIDDEIAQLERELKRRR